ncbi:MAG: OsmC family protein [Verrucomicrobiales bacterium]
MTTMESDTIEVTLNGINAPAQAATIGAIRENPGLAGVGFHAETRWSGGTRTTTTAGSFIAAGTKHERQKQHHTDSDLPLPFHGSDQAAAPAEIALHALGACLTSSLVYHCTARGIEVRSVRAEIDASLDARGFLRVGEPTAPGFSDVSVTLHADTDAEAAELQEIVDHAPMLDVFTRPIPVKATVEIAA